MAIEVRDVERIRVHSSEFFLSSTLTSCSRESSRAASGVMIAVVDKFGGRDARCRMINKRRDPGWRLADDSILKLIVEW